MHLFQINKMESKIIFKNLYSTAIFINKNYLNDGNGCKCLFD